MNYISMYLGLINESKTKLKVTNISQLRLKINSSTLHTRVPGQFKCPTRRSDHRDVWWYQINLHILSVVAGQNGRKVRSSICRVLLEHDHRSSSGNIWSACSSYIPAKFSRQICLMFYFTILSLLNGLR